MTHRRPSLAMAALAAMTLLASPRAARATPAQDAAGTYRMQGKARVSARPVFDQDVDAHADATLEPGARPRELRARLASEGYRCDLVASLADGGALSFAPGQRCTLDVRSDEARGRIEARLASGSGRVRAGRLELALAWELSGNLSLRTADRVQVLGRDVELPAAWTPDAPVRGDARATVDGHRDESRRPAR